jgi:flagellar biosynthesis regulator FlaF
MGRKPMSEAERREAEQLRAAEERAEKQREALEEEQLFREEARTIYEKMWAQYPEDLKKGKNYANRELLTNLTTFSKWLVPIVMTAKEHTSLVLELSEKLTSDDRGGSGDESTLELTAKWLNGELDLSRIPLPETSQ